MSWRPAKLREGFGLSRPRDDKQASGMNRNPNTIGLARLHREATSAGTKKPRRFRDRGSPARGVLVAAPTELLAHAICQSVQSMDAWTPQCRAAKQARPMTFAEIERTIVDYFDRHDAKVEERGAEWFLIDEEENTISLTGLAAAMQRMLGGERS